MKKHLLLTVGDDLNSLYGVRFIASFFRNKTDTRLTLFYVAPRFDAMDSREAALQHQMDRKMAELYRAKGQNALDTSLRFLCDHVCVRENLTTRLIFKRHGTVKDIIMEGREGLYDAVVLGRRGYTLFEGAFSNSVSREMLDRDVDFPLWICRRPEMGRKNVLLCVDETEPSLRIADHVGFILNGEEDHNVTLFHVDSGEGKNVDVILQQAHTQLTENALPPERIKILVKRSNKVVKTILEEVERGAYAAVAVGRGGAKPKGMFKKWMIGSRSTNLLEILEKAALWVSR